jgi:hypothetical protein
MPTPANQELYDKVKEYADTIYSKPRIIKYKYPKVFMLVY